MKNSVGVLVSYCLAQLKIMIVIIAILWIGFFIAGIGHSFIYSVFLLIIYAICLVLKQVLQPKMMGDSMGISALTTIFLIYVGLKFGGLGGMLLALILGMFVINLYRLGVFDRKIAFFKRRFEMLTINSEEEEKENKKE